MAHTLFISDLHLANAFPQTTALFFHFLHKMAPQAEALYILGDLFEYWLGDDMLDHDPMSQDVALAIGALAQRGVKVFFMAGNRDFLVGERFARQAGFEILPDPTLIHLYGQRVLLMHGDTLCTDDLDYQRFREEVRQPGWRHAFLAQSYRVREAMVMGLRKQSEQAKAAKLVEIMDVNGDTVASVLQQHAYPALIHGHTHRPARHIHRIQGQVCTRWVLPDWGKQSVALQCNDAFHWQMIDIALP